LLFALAPGVQNRPVPDHPDANPPRIHFGDFELDVANARLSRCGAPVELAPKAFELLSHLAQRPGELVLKDTLLDTVWGRRFVSEGAVKTVVSELRAALGDDARAPRWIETVQRRGYRFIGAVGAAPPGPALTGPAPVAETLPGARGNLPASLPELIAREAELAAIDLLLGEGRLVTVCGPAGVGKTSLALAVADGRRARHADGAWLVELAPLPAETADTAGLRATLARALQIPPASVASDESLVRAIQGQGLLLVLDNAEHVLEALAPLVAALHRQLPLVKWLVTSREPLQIAGEQVLRLEPLGVPAPETDDDPDQVAHSGAMRLFVQRVAARMPGFAPGPGQRRAVAQVCRALDGLPLALELAAARVPVLGMHGLASHLAGDEAAGGRLQLLTHAPRTAAPHQRTLRAALDWSHDLLKPGEQRVFRRLAVFRGGFTLASAQSVCADAELDAWGVLDALEALIEKSMIAAPRHDEGAVRFTLLESLREYAGERLLAAGESAATRRRHLQTQLAHWRHADAVALVEPVLAWTAHHTSELDNLRAALRWAQGSLAAEDDPAVAAELLALVGCTAMFWQRAGLLAEGWQWCQAVRGRADSHPDPLLRAGIDLALATLCRYTPQLPAAESLQLTLSAAEVFAQAGDVPREYFATYLAWALALEIGEEIDRSPYVARMLALVQPGWNLIPRRFVRSAWAQDERLQGRQQVFLQATREDFEEFRRLGAHGESWSAGLGLMLAEHDQGRPDRAIAAGHTLVEDIRRAGRLRTYAQSLSMHATMLAESGDIGATRAALHEALPMMSSMSACEILLLALAWLASHEGRDADAAQVLGWFDSPRRGTGVYGPRTFTRRTATALASRLEERLGADRVAALRTQSETLGDAAAVRLGLETDGNPTGS
jgi:predicted ATPase/DNA-binding winged helix-turn-helix (wHTH) protein